MAVINNVASISKDIDVLSKYEALLDMSLGEHSVYIRTKDTLTQLVKDGNISEATKADVLSKTLGAITGTITGACLQGAISWGEKEKEVELQKEEINAKVELIANQAKQTEYEAGASKAKEIHAQAQTIREYGTPTVDANTNKVMSLANDGKFTPEIEFARQKALNEVTQGLILDGQVKQSQAAVHKVVADTYANFGNYTYTLTDNGITSVVDQTTDPHNTAMWYQKQIGAAQVNGYVYNLWANAVTATSATVGTALSMELPVFDEGQIGYNMINTLSDLVCRMKSTDVPNAITHNSITQAPTSACTTCGVIPSLSASDYSISNGGVTTITIKFNVAVTGLTMNSIVATKGTLSNLATADNKTYTVNFMANATGDGTVSLASSYNANKVTIKIT